jgi:hypothetical protein
VPYQTHWERPFGVRNHFTEVFAPDEVARAVESVTSDTGFDDLRYMIFDLREATGHSFDLRSRSAVGVPYAALIGASYSNAYLHAAFLVTRPELERLVELTLSSGVLPMPAQIFHAEADARAWFGEISGSYRRPPLP